MRKILTIQVFLVLFVAALGAWFVDSDTGQAALYGGGIALVNTLLLGFRVQRASANAQHSANQGTFTLYIGAVERFVFTLLAFVLGMGWLKLQAVPLLAAFAIAQLGYWIAAPREQG